MRQVMDGSAWQRAEDLMQPTFRCGLQFRVRMFLLLRAVGCAPNANTGVGVPLASEICLRSHTLTLPSASPVAMKFSCGDQSRQRMSESPCASETYGHDLSEVSSRSVLRYAAHLATPLFIAMSHTRCTGHSGKLQRSIGGCRYPPAYR